MDDWRLLREYVERGSESAFRELVRRHLDLVYGACRRELADPELAKEFQVRGSTRSGSIHSTTFISLEPSRRRKPATSCSGRP